MFVLFMIICMIDFPSKRKGTFNLSCIPGKAAAGVLIPALWSLSGVFSMCRDGDKEEERRQKDEDVKSEENKKKS